ncbi:hypothetical protein PVAP13_8KG311301 [Panicum virgatum]|uniref:Uncharacterized protein n=1 Tax=Panicum virgatum TaxID=38727 RepID=A0A8T0PRJ4_PANVG|nr:hypothetical protein PVAP13_8KG311301 [Panicum virgatum]
MVSIAVMGGEAQIWTTYERLAVEACLRQLKDHGYIVPDFSYFRIKQLQARESNVILTTERLTLLSPFEISSMVNLPLWQLAFGLF